MKTKEFKSLKRVQEIFQLSLPEVKRNAFGPIGKKMSKKWVKKAEKSV